MPPTREQLMAMTTNERLYEAGMIDRFDEATAQRNAESVREILRAVYVDERSIEMILRDIGL